MKGCKSMLSVGSLRRLNPEIIKAVIFDMDGVITDTAETHAHAWKKLFDEYLKERSERLNQELKPFDISVDYYHYVDGKPRYEGVKSFLESRGISLPFGNPDDNPETETICGLGNRKNQYFLESLQAVGAKAYPSSIEFVHSLKDAGIGIAIISSSRNCEAVLEAAGVDGLFDVKVDGVDSAELGLNGKPQPDIFLEAARRLGVRAHEAVVIEDALAGVEAGCKGKFRMVIGVDRVGQADEFRKLGASVVVNDLSDLYVSEKPPSPETQPLKNLPSALEWVDEIFHFLRKASPAIFLDYDGTLTPIVERPEDATLPEKTRGIIESLAEHYTVAVISGRDLGDVQSMVGISDIVYAGSHGFDIAGPGGEYSEKQIGNRFLPALNRAENSLEKTIREFEGARVERKRFTIAVHYRSMDESLLDGLEKAVDKVISDEPELRKSTGKKVFELLPDIEWNKGKALLSLLDTLYVDSSKAVPLFIGDDITDEDAFRAIRNRGVSIIVGTGDRETAARYSLRDSDEVARFLEIIHSMEETGKLADVWTLEYDDFDPEEEGLREALCTLGNGYFATRGAAPESHADGIHYPGTYIAGCFNRLKTEIAGHVLENESMVNAPNWLLLGFRLENGNWFNIDQVELNEYKLQLDLRRGVLGRFARFTDEQGRRTRVFQRCFVHMSDPHLAGLDTTIVAENWSGELEVRSALDGRVTNAGVERYSQLDNRHLAPVEEESIDSDTVYLQVRTTQSRILISEAARTRVFQDGEVIGGQRSLLREPGYIGQEFTISLSQGNPVTIEKIVSLYTSKDCAISESGLQACKKVARAADFDTLLQRHILSWDHLWRRCSIHIKNNQRTALVLKLHIFHLLQTASPDTIDLDVGIPCRGLHGEAYRGHILWDELFIFPFLNLRIPDITRSLLRYRYRRLPEARWAAKQAGYEGAMYPWQSGSDGREESQTIHLNPLSGRWIPDNSHLQRHINCAIAYNTWMYYQVTHDIDFLCFYGGEMIFDIARFWASVAHYNRSTDRFEIHGVMGPDEYHEAYPDAEEPGLRNNTYTNIMVVWTFCRALEIMETLPDDRREALSERLGIRREEVELWDQISRKMKIAFHDDGIISQFEGYGDLKEFDWEGYREKYGNIQRLDRILESEGDSPNRYKVSKQADLLMLFYLLSADELRELFHRLGYPFDRNTIPRNIEYYIKRTCHGSTLSRVVHSWVLARSQRELSWHFFKEALESDISDIQGGTTAEGIHLGAMAGTVDLIQRCYTGIETRGDTLKLAPFLPNDLKDMNFDLFYRQHKINLSIGKKRVLITSLPRNAAAVSLAFKDTHFELKPGESAEFEL
ncbi:MAG: trehalose-phosphatase [Dehalococcoidia bacterium]